MCILSQNSNRVTIGSYIPLSNLENMSYTLGIIVFISPQFLAVTFLYLQPHILQDNDLKHAAKHEYRHDICM